MLRSKGVGDKNGLYSDIMIQTRILSDISLLPWLLEYGASHKLTKLIKNIWEVSCVYLVKCVSYISSNFILKTKVFSKM